MNKRTDTIRSLFAAPQSDALSGDNNGSALPRVLAGSVRSLKDSFSGFERENQALRDQMAAGDLVITVDPALVDPSPTIDRFEDPLDPSFEALMASMRERGQEVPILIRVHPTSPGRYQSAYGHRRVRAARELGIQVKAILRNLSDEDLAIAQGVENSARQDLSFIERAVFATRLETAGHARLVVQQALSIDRAEASKLVSVARDVPPDVINAIGRAPKAGRPRWQSLADALKTSGALKRARAAITHSQFAQQTSDERFVHVLSAARRVSQEERNSEREPRTVVTASGQPIARVTQSNRELKFAVDRGTHAGFATFLIDELPRLFEAYLNRPTGE
jgi:ParB family chromosome partitioning protein